VSDVDRLIDVSTRAAELQRIAEERRKSIAATQQRLVAMRARLDALGARVAELCQPIDGTDHDGDAVRGGR
jgi:uncharacterized protein with GYD domain